ISLDNGALRHVANGLIVADPVTDLREVEFREIAKRLVEAQQWKEFTVPGFLVLTLRECEARQCPTGFYVLFEVGPVRPNQRVLLGAFDSTPGVLPESSVPSRAASIVPGDKQ